MALPYNQAPIGRLIADILRIVLWIAANESHRPYYKKRGVQMTWIRLGHVCTFWRAILMDMPALWARDVSAFGTQHALEGFLARTQNTPLELVYHSDLSSIAVSQVVQLFPRAGSLDCLIKTPDEAQLVLDSIKSRLLPLLHSLVIYNASLPSALQGTSHGRFQSLSGLQALHTLDLSRVYLCPPLSGRLINLTITNPPISSRPSRNDILNVLSHNTALKYLRLVHTLDEHSTAAVSPQLDLPALVSLSVCFKTTDALRDFLGALRIPAIQRLDVTVVGLQRCSANDVYNVLANALAVYHPTFDVSSSSGFLLEAMIREKDLRFRLAFDYEKSSEDQGLFVDISFAPELSINSSVVGGAIQCFSDAKVSDHIRELIWFGRHDGYETAEYWDMLFSSFKNVEELLLRNATHPTTAAAVRSLISHNSEGKLRLPVLRRVITNDNPSLDYVLQRSRKLAQTLRRRVYLGVPTCALWLSVTVPYHSSEADFIDRVESLAETHGVQLRDLNRRNDQLEWHIKAEN